MGKSFPIGILKRPIMQWLMVIVMLLLFIAILETKEKIGKKNKSERELRRTLSSSDLTM